MGGKSACVGAKHDPMLHVVCMGLVTAGLIVALHFATGGLDSTEDAARALGVDEDDIENIKDGVGKALKATVGVGIGAAGLALILAFFRTWLSVSMLRRRSSIPRRSSLAYLCLLLPSLLLTWLCLAWMVVALMATAVWMAAAWTTDKGSRSVVDSDVNDKWLLVHTVYAGIERLTQAYRATASVMPEQVAAQLGPIVDAVSVAAPMGGEVCPKDCFDLSSWNIVSPAASCFCDLSRFQAAAPHANTAALDKLPYAILGLGLAAVGFSWLAMAQAVHASRTMRDRMRAQEGMSEQGSEASPSPRFHVGASDSSSPNSALHKHNGAVDLEAEGASSASEEAHAGLGWGGVSGISGYVPSTGPGAGGGRVKGAGSGAATTDSGDRAARGRSHSASVRDPADSAQAATGYGGVGGSLSVDDVRHDATVAPYPPVYQSPAPQPASASSVRWFNIGR